MNVITKVAASFRRRFGRHGLAETKVVEPELLVVKPKPMVGLFSTLTEEQKRKALMFTAPHDFGEEPSRAGQ